MAQREISLDPVIALKLAAFRKRARTLLVVRAATTGIISFFASLAVFCAIDWLVLIPDWSRWFSAALVYAISIFSVHRSAALLFSRQTDEDLARQIELLKPELRENLIAAVELGDKPLVKDSPIFRQFLQNHVTAQLRDLDVASLLPWTHVKRAVRWSGLMLLIASAFCLFPGSLGPTLFARTLFPWSNLARISQTRITVLLPEQADAIVPRGDTINISMRLSGKPSRHAALDYRGVAGRWETMEMTQIKPGEFYANIPIAGEPLEYRLLAGDGVTQVYRLTPKPRPHVIHFEKTYHFPRYSGLEPTQKIEVTGDISGLEGSEADLRLHLDQSVSRAELEILSPNNRTNVLSLNKEAPNQWALRIPLVERQTYRVHLVSEETGFENKFSPQYEIRPIPDLPPNVRLKAPDHDLAAAPDASIEILGEATDDLPVLKLLQQVRVNNGAWNETPISNPSKTNGTIQLNWDLIGLNLSAGDSVETKIQAIDLKGARVESPPIRVTIISKTLDLKRMQVVEQHRRIGSAFTSLRLAAETLAHSFLEAAESLRAEDADLQARQIGLKLLSQSETFNSRIVELLDLVEAALPESRRGFESRALFAVGNSLLQVRYGGAGLILQSLNNTGLASESSLRTAASQLISFAASADSFGRFLDAEQIGMRAENLFSLFQEQSQLLANWRDDSRGNNHIKRRESAATRSLRIVEQNTTNSLVEAVGISTNLLRDPDLALKAARIALESKIQENSLITTNNVVGYGNSIQQALAKTLLYWQTISKELKIDDADLPAPVPANLQSDYWDSLADLEEFRLDSDARFVGDLRNSAQALREPLDQLSANLRPDELQAHLRQRLQVGRLDHGLEEIADALQMLNEGETWEDETIGARTELPVSWFLLKQLAERSGREFQSLGLTNRLPDLNSESVGETASSRIETEMRQRYDLKHSVQSVAPEARALIKLFNQPLVPFQKRSDSARQAFPSSNSGFNVRLQSLASKVEELQAATRNAITNSFNELDAARELLARQRKSNQQIEYTLTELRQRANLHEIKSREDLEELRDYDDAMVLLSQPPLLAERTLQDAIEARSPIDRGQNLESAAGQQDKTARLLHRLAGQFENSQFEISNNGRESLRQGEDTLGLKSIFDQRYRVALILAESGPSTAVLSNKLTAALTADRVMQQELHAISRSAIANARHSLIDGADKQLAISDLLKSRSRTEAASRAALILESERLLEDAKKLAAETLLNLQVDPGVEPRLLAATESANKSVASALSETNIELRTAVPIASDELKKRIDLIEGARVQAVNVERTAAEAKAEALKSEEGLASAAGKVEEKLREARTKLGNDTAELSRLEAQMLKLNTEELQHLHEQFQSAVDRDRIDVQAGESVTAKSQSGAKTAKDATARLEKFNQYASQLTKRIAALAERLQNIGNRFQNLARESQVQRADIASREEPVRKQVSSAFAEVSHAFGHYQRLQGLAGGSDNTPPPVLEKEFKLTLDNIKALREDRIPSIQKSIEQSGPLAGTQTLVEKLGDQMAQDAAGLQMLNDSWSSPEISGDRARGPVFDMQSKWLARLLHVSANASGSIGSERPGLESTFQSALQSCRATLATARTQMTHIRVGNSPSTHSRRNEEWHGIPSRLAGDLVQSRREIVSPQYQAMVDSYFKAIADKARQGMP
jgi:hypothetical protein